MWLVASDESTWGTALIPSVDKSKGEPLRGLVTCGSVLINPSSGDGERQHRSLPHFCIGLNSHSQWIYSRTLLSRTLKNARPSLPPPKICFPGSSAGEHHVIVPNQPSGAWRKLSTNLVLTVDDLRVAQRLTGEYWNRARLG